MRVLVTGGGGFIGTHACEFYARKGMDVVAYDNLSRAQLLGQRSASTEYNWEHLKQYPNVELVKGDVRDGAALTEAAESADVIIHTAAQTAVTTSIIDPMEDFSVNVVGTLNVLEAARTSGRKPVMIFCSTNKVYGENVNALEVIEENRRYRFGDGHAGGIPESFDIDLCEHTPYGCSKLAGDLYMQDYAHLYDLKIGVFRMSCIYGTHQFGIEDQGWVAWFTIATVMGWPLTIYGDGKQVRDILFVSDLIRVIDAFLESPLSNGVFNIGGGPKNVLSLLELLDLLEKETGKRSRVTYEDWRPSDQKVYISNIDKAQHLLGWQPEISPEEGLSRLVKWVEDNKAVFKKASE